MNAPLVALGFSVGLIVGLTGVGGASVMTPLLVLVLKIDPLVAVGTDLAYSVPTKLFGAFVHHRQRTIDWRVVGTLLCGGIPTALVGLAAVASVRHHADQTVIELWTRRAIGIALVISAALMMVRPILSRGAKAAGDNAFTMRRAAIVAAIGAFVGFIVSTTSIGSGSLTLPLLTLVLPGFGVAELVGSDVAFAGILVGASALGRWSMGDVDPRLAFNLLLGSLPGVFLGAKLCSLLSQTWLRPAVAVLLVYVGTRLVGV
jgi:uncharacterized membrane protein YfcA